MPSWRARDLSLARSALGMRSETLKRSSFIEARAAAVISRRRSLVSVLTSGWVLLSKSSMNARSSALVIIFDLPVTYFTFHISSFQTTALKCGFQENFILSFDIGNAINIVIDQNHEHPLMRVFFLIRMRDVIQKAVCFKNSHDIFKTDRPDLACLEFSVFLDAPDDSFHPITIVWTEDSMSSVSPKTCPDLRGVKFYTNPVCDLTNVTAP